MGPGDVILALDSPTSSAMASWALGGLHSLPSSPPSSKPCRGHQSQRDVDYCCCAPGTASLWQFCISLPETLYTPIVPHARQSLGGSTPSAILPCPANSYWEFQHFSHPPGKKHSPFIFPPWASHWCWDSPLHGALAVAGSAAHQDAPRVCNPSLPAAPKGSTRCPGRPFTCCLLTNKNTHL